MSVRLALCDTPIGAVLYRTRRGRARPAAGATVHVYAPGTEDEIDVYARRTGSLTLPQPLTTDKNGVIPGYVERRLFDVEVVYLGVVERRTTSLVEISRAQR